MQHLSNFGRNRLDQTGELGARKKTNHKWYETHDSINYWDDFNRQKIIYPGIMRIAKSDTNNFPRFALDSHEHFFFSNDCYFIVGENLEYLWLLLNSTLLGYLFRYYIYSFDETGFKIVADNFKNIPLPLPNKNRLAETKKILDNQVSPEFVNAWIYDMMNFSQDEIEEIENSVRVMMRDKEKS